MSALLHALNDKNIIAMIKMGQRMSSFPSGNNFAKHQKARVHLAFVLTLFLNWGTITMPQLGNKSRGSHRLIASATKLIEFISRYGLFNARLSAFCTERFNTPCAIALRNAGTRSTHTLIYDTKLNSSGSAYACASRADIILECARWNADVFKSTWRTKRSHARSLQVRSTHRLRACLSLSLCLDAIRFCLAPSNQPDRSPRANRIYGLSEVLA